MNAKLGLIFADSKDKFQRQKIEDEISNLLTVSYDLTKHIIDKNRTLLDKLKSDVMKSKTLDTDYFQNLKLNQRYGNTSKLFNDFINRKESTGTIDSPIF
jgi:ATP-dependent Zn protease